MITLIINYKDQINPYMKMLVDEVGKASNIKSRVTRQNVTDALTSTMESKIQFNDRIKIIQQNSRKRFNYLLWISRGR